MKKILIGLVLTTLTSQAALLPSFLRRNPQTEEQKKIKCQFFPVACQKCKSAFVLQPCQAFASGSHSLTNGSVQEWTLIFQDAKNHEIRARYETQVAPTQVVAPIPVPPMTKPTAKIETPKAMTAHQRRITRQALPMLPPPMVWSK